MNLLIIRSGFKTLQHLNKIESSEYRNNIFIDIFLSIYQ